MIVRVSIVGLLAPGVLALVPLLSVLAAQRHARNIYGMPAYFGSTPDLFQSSIEKRVSLGHTHRNQVEA
jgi:hypothetical protein